MTAATRDVRTDQYGSDPIPALYAFPVAASSTIRGGTMVGTNASGYAVKATASAALKLWGRAEALVDNSAGSNGDKYVEVRPGVFYFNNDTTNAVTIADRGAYVFSLDDNVVGRSSLSGTLPLAGYVIDVPASGTPNYGKVAVAVGMARPDSLNPELADDVSLAYKARAVATSIAAYTAASGVITASATGAIGAQDGVTMVATDLLLIPEGLSNVTAADAGPYIVTNAGSGSAAFVLTRPDWWPHGGGILPGAVIQLGADGTLFKGSAWKTFVAKSKVVGTDAPLLYPDYVCQSVTLASGVITVSNVPILSATKSFFGINRTTLGGTASGTYNPTTITAGVLGTGSFQVSSQSITGTTNASDTSTLNIAVENW